MAYYSPRVVIDLMGKHKSLIYDRYCSGLPPGELEQVQVPL